MTTSPTSVRGGRRLLVLALLTIVLATRPAGGEDAPLGPGETADEWQKGRYSAERVELRVRVLGTSYRNYFRAPDDEEAVEVRSTTLEGRATFTLHRASRIKLYLQAIREGFEDEGILTSPTLSTGLRIDGERHGLDVALRYQKDREQLDLDDETEPSDIYTYFLGYSLRVADDWEWALEGEIRDQRFSPERQTEDTELASANLSLRYRGWGRRFSPEIGWEQRRRSAVDPHDEYDESIPWVKLRLSPFDRLAMSLRYRYRARDYAVRDPDDSNFEREDRRDEWTLRADWIVARRLALNLEAEQLDTESTRDGRTFSAGQVTLGMTIKVGPMRQRPPTTARPLPAGTRAPRPVPGPPSRYRDIRRSAASDESNSDAPETDSADERSEDPPPPAGRPSQSS